MQLVYEKFNLTKMLHKLKPLVESKINEKNIHYIEDINIKHECFIGDELRLNQVLVNFLSNVIKYCNKDGNIKLIVSEQVIENSNVQLAFAEDVKCSLASGMNGHLSKPIDRVKLKEVLVKCLNK